MLHTVKMVLYNLQCCKVVFADGPLGSYVQAHASNLVLMFTPPPETPSNCLVLSRFYIYSRGILFEVNFEQLLSVFLFAEIIWTGSNAE